MSRLMEHVYRFEELGDLDPAERRLALRDVLAEVVAPESLGAAVREVASAIDGFGPLTGVMTEPGITDVLVNGPHEVWVERRGKLELTDVTFEPDELMAFVERHIGDAGGRVDASCPIADARLHDGSRIHVVLPPLAPDGPLVSIRRFPQQRYTLEDLRRSGTVDDAQVRVLVQAVHDRRSIVVSGATGSGKTTLACALLGLVGPDERIVVVEETPELRPQSPHAVSLLARRANVEGRGAVGLIDLVRAALRMRPDRIVVGEVRGPEAAAAIEAMSTGHRGSLLTVHAMSAALALSRLAALACEGTANTDHEVVGTRVRDAVDVVVHLARRGPRRVVEEILECR